MEILFSSRLLGCKKEHGGWGKTQEKPMPALKIKMSFRFFGLGIKIEKRGFLSKLGDVLDLHPPPRMPVANKNVSCHPGGDEAS